MLHIASSDSVDARGLGAGAVAAADEWAWCGPAAVGRTPAVHSCLGPPEMMNFTL